MIDDLPRFAKDMFTVDPAMRKAHGMVNGKCPVCSKVFKYVLLYKADAGDLSILYYSILNVAKIFKPIKRGMANHQIDFCSANCINNYIEKAAGKLVIEMIRQSMPIELPTNFEEEWSDEYDQDDI